MQAVDTWTGARADSLREALRLTNEGFAAHLGIAIRTVAKWRAQPDVVPKAWVQQLLDTALQQASNADQERFTVLVSPAPPARMKPVIENLTAPPEEVFMTAAMEVTNGMAMCSTKLGSDAIELLHSQMTLVARQYSDRPPMSVFAQARRLRQTAEQMAERTRRPGELADVYLVVSGSTALMASIAFDLGHWPASAHMAKAATSYAELADHRALMAWTLGLQGTLAFWRDDLVESEFLLQRGLDCAPPGRHRFRLRYIASRTYALRDDAASTARVLAEAEDDRQGPTHVPDPLMDNIQGEFAFDDARAAACAGAAWLQLGNGEQAERYTNTALDLYLAEPEQQRPFSPLNGARIDTAAARLLQGELDGAQEVLSPVFMLSPSHRNTALTGRLDKVRGMLNERRWEPYPEARRLSGAVTEWLAENATAPLPHAD
ncbi:hypothetical protein [Embleya sp. NPDC001921]